MSLEQPQQNNDIRMWSFSDWKRAIEDADPDKRLAHYNDVITGRDTPSPELSKHLVLKDVSLGGKICDVYHWDQDEDGKRIRNSSANRVFVHIKE